MGRPALHFYLNHHRVYLSLSWRYGYFQSQLYGSTTVVMATHGLHWKWQSLTPCQRHPSEPIEKIFGTIDYVIDLNNLAKFGFGKIFPDGDTHTQHIRVRTFFFFFFFNFLRSLMRVQPKRLNQFWCAIRHSTPFGESQTLFQKWKISVNDLDLEKVKIRHFVWPEKFWPEFSRKRYEIERKCQ